MANDNSRSTRAELEAANRSLRASLKKCEELVAECRDKLEAAGGTIGDDSESRESDSRKTG